ncbi:class I SAM-dependent rRNA methyltransferase [Mongoliibacter ruber]|uniref:23S rRNA (Cytosine1962-C5)-methyltransferase n=1 Tax=Mongoliibacter ruber TaxID=1750599 RepID=A0A2T0WW13_9BACT|nr:class I SAM-dependent rRNA methyltransferase [Mongoliibacter ruber]PRY90784.1 23S rRNA (cytosine1962-C5)-methyltransferase [Mongoliibacter ruber]
MLPYPKVQLLRSKEISILRKHHWIFSGAIAQKDDDLKNGQLVQVFSAKDIFLGIGHFQYGSIMVRLISFEEKPIDLDFWTEKIQRALELRKALGLWKNEETNVFRLIHGEGDGLPGLIIDFYNGTAVIQTHHVGMYRHVKDIADALKSVLGDDLKSVYEKSAETLPRDIGVENRVLFGSPDTNVVSEYGSKYEIDWEKGQKTGFFIDQRENRHLLAKYSQGKKVLNTFCYSGGFSIAALNAGAQEVHSVDISAKAIELTERNLELNADVKGKHESVVADVVKYIREIENDYDLVVLDPPAFAKNIKSRHNAVQAYKRLNAEALKRIKKGGILFTFSCSQVVDKQLFANTITAAAHEIGRNIKILHYLSQPGDHPINIFHPETEYLKGLVLFVE